MSNSANNVTVVQHFLDSQDYRDGVSRAGELLSMTQANISAISLTAQAAHWDNRAGNGVLFGGSYTNSVGQQREVVAVAFTTDQVKEMVRDLIAGDRDKIGYTNVSYMNRMSCTEGRISTNDNKFFSAGALAA